MLNIYYGAHNQRGLRTSRCMLKVRKANLSRKKVFQMLEIRGELFSNQV